MSRVEIIYPEESHYSKCFEVRISDVNYQKHLGHDRLVSMIHEARSAFFEGEGLPEISNSSLGTLVADLAIAFQEEAFYGDELRFDISVQDLSNRSCQLYYQVKRVTDEVTIATAKSGVVFYDYAAKKAVPVPETFSNKYC